jgi:hypothetical protein
MKKPIDVITIYHITHIDNLPGIIKAGGLYSQEVFESKPTYLSVGMAEVKRRRASRKVECFPGTMVAEYVPFYFCPRSVMLYILHKGNHPGITYKGGQEPILHLCAPLRQVVTWASRAGRNWCFTNANATAWYTDFYNSVSEVDNIDWQAVESLNFANEDIKEAKQAEFLMHEFFDFSLFTHIGVCSLGIRDRVSEILMNSGYNPSVAVHKDWYF